MKTINKTELLISIFIPTLVLSVVYFVLGHFIKIPNLLLFCIIGTFTIFPIELGIILKASKKETGNYFFSEARNGLLSHLPTGFDWMDYAYLRTFSKPMLVLTCIYYFLFNVFDGPITEELFFRGYLTSHYNKQTASTPIVIAILFSLYHFWLPFNNVFRILAFAPVAYVAYKKKNIYISILFHCMCNLFSVVGFIVEVMK